MPKHTATPWKADRSKAISHELHDIRIKSASLLGDRSIAAVFGWNNNSDPTLEVGQANADFIVLAVNAHDALVAACKQLLAVVDRLPNGHSAERVLSAQAGRAALKLAGE